MVSIEVFVNSVFKSWFIDAFDVLVQNGFTITDEDAIKLKGWYESKDSRNRERTYRYLLSQEY
jgi:hypothetical protein